MTMSQRMWMREQERRKRERLRRARRRRNCALVVFLLAVVSVVLIILLMNNGSEKSAESGQVAEYTQSPDFNTDNAQNPYVTTISQGDIKQSFFKNSAFAGGALAESIEMYGILEDARFYSNINADLENVYTMTTNGSTTSIVEQFKSKNFKKVFLSFGENELKNGNSSDFKIKYRELVDKIREYQPNVMIYLISIPPITAEASDKNDNGITMSRILSYNKQIKTLAVEEDLYFVDSVDALGNNMKFLPTGVSLDGINLNKAAVIDLIYYMVGEAYIPTRQDLEDDEDEEVTEDETDTSEETTESEPEIQQTEEPDDSVNVLKDSVIRQNEG